MTMKFYSTQVVQMGDVDRGNVQLWNWNNTAVSGYNLITEANFGKINSLIKGDWKNYTLCVPKVKGKSLLKWEWAGAVFANSQYKNYIQRIDMQKVPWNENVGGGAFRGCRDLRYVVNINNSCNNLSEAFSGCVNFNFNVQLPPKLIFTTNMFYNCFSFNQELKFHARTTSFYQTFYNCTSLNRNIQFTSGGDLHQTFRNCISLNQSIQIPNGTKNMWRTFENCYALATRINVLSTEVTNAVNTFYGTSKAKQVYIYYKYANGVNTNTYNIAVSNWSGKNGVTLCNLGKAPW